MTDATFDRCADFAAGLHTLAELTAWLYGTCDDDWGEDGALYLELLDIHYGTRFADGEARTLLRRAIEARCPGEVMRRQAGRIARELIDGRLDVRVACRELVLMHRRGVTEIETTWIGFDDELDNPWDPSASDLAQIVEQARALLARLAVRPS